MATTQQPVYWSGTISKCNLCPQPLGDVDGGRAMYDVRIPAYGSWANVCYGCFQSYGCTLGTGLGQSYALQPDGRWLKTGD